MPYLQILVLWILKFRKSFVDKRYYFKKGRLWSTEMGSKKYKCEHSLYGRQEVSFLLIKTLQNRLKS
ncbi:mCG147996 [Mus musculus]|nr:mCG147996 [Mus musculus]